MEAGTLRLIEEKYEVVEAFLNIVKNVQSKQEFMSRVRDFDLRFTQQTSAPTFSERQKSTEKLPPVQHEKPKNPFKSLIQENYKPTPRQNQFMGVMSSQQQRVPPNYQNQGNVGYQNMHPYVQNVNQNMNQYAQNQQNMPRIPPHSRSEQNFFKNGMSQNQFGQNITNQGHLAGLNSAISNNYNFSQEREYNELKEQFFKPLPKSDFYGKIPNESLNNSFSRQNEQAYNMNALAMGLGLNPSNQGYGEANIFGTNFRQGNMPTPIYSDNRHNPFKN